MQLRPIVTRTDRERFESFVDRHGPIPAHAPELGPCHLWTGLLSSVRNDDEVGYARFSLDGKLQQAHRVLWEWENGPIPEKVQLDHRCFTHNCVNLEHLRPTTNKQNHEHMTGPRRDNAHSKYRGVSWDGVTQKWKVRVQHDGRSYWGGRFTDEDEAGEQARVIRNRLYTHNDLDRQQAA